MLKQSECCSAQTGTICIRPMADWNYTENYGWGSFFFRILLVSTLMISLKPLYWSWFQDWNWNIAFPLTNKYMNKQATVAIHVRYYCYLFMDAFRTTPHHNHYCLSSSKWHVLWCSGMSHSLADICLWRYLGDAILSSSWVSDISQQSEVPWPLSVRCIYGQNCTFGWE